MNKKIIIVVIIVCTLVLFLATFNGVRDEPVEEYHSLPVDGVESAKVDLDLGVGEIHVSGGASDLVEGHFAYNVEKWKPVIKHEIEETHCDVWIKQGKGTHINLGNLKNRWDIQLNNSIIYDLKVDFGVGEGVLRMSGLNLRTLEADTGVGKVEVDLSGIKPQDTEVTIDCGIGSVTITLPEEIGARVHVDRGIGSIDASGFNRLQNTFTNRTYKTSENSITVYIDAGIGRVDLRLK